MVRLSYLLRRLLQVLPVVFAIAVLNFFLLRLAPGDMADVMAGEAGASTPEYLAQLRSQFGIDQPISVQFASYLNKLLHFDLGWSFRNGQSVASLIFERLPATAVLMILALALAVIIGCVLGTIAGLTRWRMLDMFISTLATVGFATPLFWLGLMLIVLFSVHLSWLPSSGMHTLGVQLSGWNSFVDLLKHLILPVTCLTVYYIAVYARLMRTSVTEVSKLDFIRTARAKGLSEHATVTGHVVPNALLPIVTMTALQFGALMNGSVTIETLFGWPGLGQLALNAVTSRDLNLLLGILFVSSLFVLCVNLITDFAYAWFDPRVELQ